jgi:hypothetical protein
MADTHGLGPCGAIRGGSNPFTRTIRKIRGFVTLFIFCLFAAYLPKILSGVFFRNRYANMILELPFGG